MPALHRVSCPHCGAVLKSNKGIRIGKQIQCVKCQAPFTLTAADAGASPAIAEHDLDAMSIDAQLAEGLSAPRPGLLEVHGTEMARQGILEPGHPTPVALTVNDRPLPQAARMPIPKALPFAPPRRSSAAAVVAWGALLLLLAGAGFVAYLCFFDGPSEAEQPPVARNEKDIPSVTASRPPEAAPGIPAPAPAEELREPEPSPQSRPPARPKKEPPLVRRTPRDVPPAMSFRKPGTSKAKPHPEQKRIDEAVERGLAFLRTQQTPSGSWGDGLHGVGYAALPGLTLLECGVTPSDPAVQRAARFVRENTAHLAETYDLSLAILFLDRLGESRDRKLIQKLALRLVAGQTVMGGWDYKCRVLTSEQSEKLLTYLQRTRPQAPLMNPVEKSGTAPSSLPTRGGAEKPAAKSSAKSPSLVAPIDPKDLHRKGGKPGRAEFLPDFIRDLPIQQKRKGKMVVAGRDDNSCSQFALLALWAARRHDVPTEQTLALAEERYRAFHNQDGGWGYMIGMPSTAAMTCVGLLGLGVGHGASHDGLRAAVSARNNVPPRLAKEDAAIKKGLRALGTAIGTPHTAPVIPPMANLYFLWSLERVAMLYSLETIGGRDWYGWGVSILLPNQLANGCWFSTQYPGQNTTIDTCFALLFLRRSNLVQDLTENLQLYLGITDPDARK